MKLGDAIHIIWTNGASASSIHTGLTYRVRDDIFLNFNDLRAIWEFLNREVLLEGTKKDAVTGERSQYISERERLINGIKRNDGGK